MSIKDPATFAKLPDGTVVKYGAPAALFATFKALPNMTAVGETGKTGGFVHVPRLIDTEKKFIADTPEGPDKEFVLVDDPDDADQEAFVDMAKSRAAVQIYLEFPNGRWALQTVALAGAKLQALEPGKPMHMVVAGKQNAIQWGKLPATPTDPV